MDSNLSPVRPSRSSQLTSYFRNPEYLSAIGGQLTQFNVLDYFSTSDFYEQGCNNAILKMQTAATDAMPTQNVNGGGGGSTTEGGIESGLTAFEKKNDPFLIEHELKRFVGLEFILAHAKPPELFVVHKRWRANQTQTKILEVFYILQGNITMASDLFTILGNKFLSTISGLQQSLDIARNAQPDFNPREGHSWRIAAEKQVEEGEEGDQKDEESEGEEEDEVERNGKR